MSGFKDLLKRRFPVEKIIRGRTIVGPTKITVDTTSKTLATLGLALNAATMALRILAPNAGVFWNYGTATTGTALLFSGTNLERNTKARLETLEFIVASGTVDIWVEELEG